MAERHSIHLANTDERYPCAESQDILRAMEVLSRKGIPVGCRGGGCGICKVRITHGPYEIRKMSRAFVSEREEDSGVVLACRVFPRGDLRLDALDVLARCVERKAKAGASG